MIYAFLPSAARGQAQLSARGRTQLQKGAPAGLYLRRAPKEGFATNILLEDETKYRYEKDN